ncbi:prefoldin subunit beta [Candidatus Woesearchaeota archaeon]|nr:prefoldin subunit beta [Candidatus Woesearchaeota archaeon]
MADQETEKKIQQLQLIEQSIQTMLMQKQQFQAQMMEAESAIKELEKGKEAYKIIGNIMVAAKKDELLLDLKQKKEICSLRINAIEKQENNIKEKAKKMRDEVVKNIEVD